MSTFAEAQIHILRIAEKLRPDTEENEEYNKPIRGACRSITQVFVKDVSIDNFPRTYDAIKAYLEFLNI